MTPRRKKGSGVFFPARARAFTLIEVIIAIALTLALLGAMFGFLFNLLGTRAAVLEASMRQRAADALFDHIQRDLGHCLVGDDVLGPGVEGDAAGVRILSRQVAITTGAAADVAATFADAQRTEYRFDESARRLEARRTDPADSDTAGTAFEPLGTEIFRVRFRYYDGMDWTETFDSLAADRLPVAIEVSIWHDPWPGEETAAAPPGAADRATFDAGAGFDESRAAILSDQNLAERPDPDHRRVFIIPDSGAGSGGGVTP